MLSIRLFGDFLITQQEQNIPIRSNRARALLVYLLIHRHAPQTRLLIAMQFWPDTSEAQARSNLRNLLTGLRQHFADLAQVVTVTPTTLAWSPNAATVVDVVEFEEALRLAEGATDEAVIQAGLERAVALYGGDLFPECYDDWILSERERLRDLLISALERLIGLLEAQRNYAKAIEYARRLLRLDPLREETCRRLMLLYALTNDAEGVARTYRECSARLSRELDAEPSPPTRELYERLTQPTQPVVPAPRWGEPRTKSLLVGRRPEWLLLMDSWERSGAGGAHCVLLHGAAGAGKTRLVSEFAEFLRRRGFTTAYTRCRPLAGEVALAPVLALLRSEPLRERVRALDKVWRSELARLLPELLLEQPDLPAPLPIPESWQRPRLHEALARVCLLRNQPILLVIDDMQWCDQETLAWLHHLLQSDPQARLLLICTVRSEAIQQHQALLLWRLALLGDHRLTELTLAPFTLLESTALLEGVRGQKVSAEEALLLHRESEGNLLVLVESGRARADGLGAPTEGATSSPTLHALHEWRLAHLSPQASDLLGLAAELGRSFTGQALLNASGLEPETLLLILDQWLTLQLVRADGEDAYRFASEALRALVRNRLSAAKRQLWQRRVSNGRPPPSSAGA